MENFNSGFSWVELLTGLSLGIVILRLLFLRLTVPKLKLPPGPGGYPIVGSFPLLGAIPGEPAHQMFKRLQDKYGPIVFLQMGSCPTIVVSDSETAKAVLRDQDHLFASRPFLSVGKYLGSNYESMVWSQMGDHYKQLRKIFAAEILSPKRVTQSHEVRENGMQATISSMFDEFSNGQPTNLTVELNNLSLNTLMNMLFGHKEGQLIGGLSRLSMEELKDVVRESIELGGEFDYGDYLPIVRWLDLTGFIGRLKSTQKRMKAISSKIIEQHREHCRMVIDTDNEQKGFQNQNILDVLLSLKGEDALSDDGINGVIFDVIIAGSDTTSISADWAIAELMRKPELLKKLQNQIDSVVGKERMVKESDLPYLPYLHNVIKESLRMHSPAPLGIPHCSTKETKLAGYDIPAGTTVLVNLWAINRDPKNWPEPDEFRPERHEVNDINMFGQDFTLLPFGSGRRGCSGMVLGFTMVQLIVASIIHSFDLEPYDMKSSDIDVVQEKPGLTMVRAQELFVKSIPRLPPHLYR